MAKKVKRLPPRERRKPEDCWDLSSLFPDDDAWEKAMKKWSARIDKYEGFRGTLGESAEKLAAFIKFDLETDRLGERLGTYAFLKTSEDAANSHAQAMYGRFMGVLARANQAASFARPEILAIPRKKMNAFLEARCLQPYRLLLQRIIEYRPHTLSRKEERLLAMQTEMAQTAREVFHQLNDADLRFGEVKNEKGEWIELTHGTFSSLLQSQSRAVRKEAFEKLYRGYEAHVNTLAASLGGSVRTDIYYARARNFSSALEAGLFPDRIPVSVYDNLIATVERFLPSLHRYYDVRRRKMRLRDIHVYDTYVPLVDKIKKRHTWNKAVDLVVASLAPLGKEYVEVLEKGLRGRWCDRYENRGKRSGAFSAGSYDGDPYILMNFQPDVFDHVFTLAHEAGHSMHSYYSAKHQPYQYYNYTLFVAEVASTFNEQLLGRFLMDRAKSDLERAYLINHELDEIRGTLFRQTMFAEFEKIVHEKVEQGEAPTVEFFTGIYRGLLEKYFGPDFALDDALSLECFRIPHFYRAFYVYKYATGISAAIALADRVLGGGKAELDDYLGFLKGGCSKDPLDLLRDAGVDMEKPDAVEAALSRFDHLVDELDRLL